MWNLTAIDSTRSLYLAVADALERDICSGILKTGDRLPTHRALAKKVGVTVTTATRVYAEAERRGLISAIVGKGTFVTAGNKTDAFILNPAQEAILYDMAVIRSLRSGEELLAPLLEGIVHKNSLSSFMRYSDSEGLPSHRKIAAKWIKRFGINASASSMIITSGGQHALFSILYSLFENGDRFATAALTYPGIKPIARRLGLRLEGIIMDEEGIIPEELESLCQRHTIKGLYETGRMHDPTNRIMSQARREALARIIQKFNIILIENDNNGFLSSYSDQTLSALVPENSVYISSLSRALWAGLRVGFICASKKICSHISQGVLDTSILTSPLNAAIACECITSGQADTIIENKKLKLATRNELLKNKLHGFNVDCPENSMAAWIELPSCLSTHAFEEAATANRLRVLTADRFSVGPNVPPNCIRVSLTGVEEYSVFEEAMDILANLLRTGTAPRNA